MANIKKTSHKKDVVYAFIDSQNLNLGVKNQGWDLDFARFRVYLKDKFVVTKAFLFIGYIPKNEKLYSYLRKSGFELVFKPAIEIRRGKKIEVKGNVDAELVLHAMIEYQNYNKAIIVSGDGDFHCLIEYLKKKEKLKRLLIPNQAKYSRLLYEFVDFIEFVSNLRRKLEQKKWEVLQSRTKP
jgi:uncharacterized LabA/DUF88 family protein